MKRHAPTQIVIIQKVTLNFFALVTECDKEFAEVITAVVFHDVPEDWPATNSYHRLGLEFGFFGQTRSKTASQNCYFHEFCISRSAAKFSSASPATNSVVHFNSGLTTPGMGPA